MNTAYVIDALNQTIALELTASLQYHQHALLVRGPWRKLFAEFFHTESHDALDHAHKFGQKVAALGGVPTIEVGAPVRQSLDLTEMLHQDLELERQAMQAYLEAHALAEGDVALRSMLESHIDEEQRDIEELEMYLEMVQTSAVMPEVVLEMVTSATTR
jgi:bacterioferritin